MPLSGMSVNVMGNGLKSARLKRGLTQEQAAEAIGISVGGYIKKEQGTRGMNDEFIRKACEVFGVKPEEVLSEINVPQAQLLGPQGEIDPEKLASFVAQAKDRLSSLSELEARNLVLALISAARRP